LGVGLQCFKKDWCEAWKARQYERKETRQAAAQPPIQHPRNQPPAKPAPQPAPTPTTPEDWKARFVKWANASSGKIKMAAWDWAVAGAVCMENERLEDGDPALFPQSDTIAEQIIVLIKRAANGDLSSELQRNFNEAYEVVGQPPEDAIPSDLNPVPPYDPESENRNVVPEPDLPARTDIGTIKGWIKVSNSKPTKKGNPRYGFGIAGDMHSQEPLLFVNTFDKKFADLVAGELKGKQIVAEYEEGKYGKELLSLKAL
jgi:hypothetical protein